MTPAGKNSVKQIVLLALRRWINFVFYVQSMYFKLSTRIRYNSVNVFFIKYK